VAYNVNIIGLDRTLIKYKQLPQKLQANVRGAVENGAKVFVRNAKRDAPVDVGFLKNQITYTKLIGDADHMTFEVISGAKYSPYLEFGTKGKFRPYPGTEQFASQFKGKGDGNMDEFFLNILDWVKRKGIADRKTRGLPTGRVRKAKDVDAYDTAFAIMMSILKKGVTPHPFFFKHIPTVKKQIGTDIGKIISSIR